MTNIPAPEDRVDSWKSIAAVLSRDERTVQRWEKTRGLPVYRVPGERGAVFAYRSELLRWLHQFPVPEPAPEPPIVEAVTPSSAERSVAPPENPPDPIAAPRKTRMWLPIAAVGLLIAASAGGVRWHKHHRESNAPAAAAEQNHHVVGEAREKEIYREGAVYWEQRTPQSLNTALKVFKEYAQKYPHSGDAYTGIAETYELLPEFGPMAANEAYPQALEAARKAVALAPESADAHRVLAFAEFYWSWHVEQALAEFKRSIALDPKSAEAHHWYAGALLLLNRIPAAEQEIAIARDLEPTSRSIYADQLLIEVSDPSRQAAAVTKLRQLASSDAQFLAPTRYLMAYYFLNANYPEYIAELKDLAEHSHDVQDGLNAKAAEAGWKRDGANGLLLALRQRAEEDSLHRRPMAFASVDVYLRLGDRAKALSRLTEAYDQREFMILSIVSRPEHFRTLSDDPTFQAISAQLKQTMTATS